MADILDQILEAEKRATPVPWCCTLYHLFSVEDEGMKDLLKDPSMHDIELIHLMRNKIVALVNVAKVAEALCALAQKDQNIYLFIKPKHKFTGETSVMKTSDSVLEPLKDAIAKLKRR